MSPEAEYQGRVTADAAHASPQGLGHVVEVCCAVIGQLAALAFAPERFDGVQLRGIGGQGLHSEPRALGGQVHPHPATGMRAQAVPQEDRALASELLWP